MHHTASLIEPASHGTVGLFPGTVADGRGRSVTNTLDGLHREVVDSARSLAPLPSGFSPLDDVLSGGFRAGDFVLIGGKPGKGKTVAALQWARNLARTGCRSLFVSFEHDARSLLLRLLTLELAEAAAELHCTDQLRLEMLRDRLRLIGSANVRIGDVVRSDPLLERAEERIRVYGEQLVLIEGSRTNCEMPALDTMVAAQPDQRCALFVDYLQKMPTSVQATSDAERVIEAAEALKELALRRAMPVVAVVAADQTGLAVRRTRLQHLRGAFALAYEADIAVMLNDKLSVVSRAHLTYDTTRIQEFRSRVVFSVEKNRAGLPDVDLEFRKDFANYRFDPVGSWVAERLTDETSQED